MWPAVYRSLHVWLLISSQACFSGKSETSSPLLKERGPYLNERQCYWTWSNLAARRRSQYFFLNPPPNVQGESHAKVSTPSYSNDSGSSQRVSHIGHLQFSKTLRKECERNGREAVTSHQVVIAVVALSDVTRVIVFKISLDTEISVWEEALRNHIPEKLELACEMNENVCKLK